MKFVIVALCLFGSALAADLKFRDYKEVPIIAQDLNIEADGKFHSYYETGLGDKAVQDGYLKKIDAQTDAEVIQGAYSFIGDDGVEYKVTYTADENGFQPQGAHLPTPPPIPAAILRSLEYLAAHPSTEEKTIYKPINTYKGRF